MKIILSIILSHDEYIKSSNICNMSYSKSGDAASSSVLNFKKWG